LCSVQSVNFGNSLVGAKFVYIIVFNKDIFIIVEGNKGGTGSFQIQHVRMAFEDTVSIVPIPYTRRTANVCI